MKLTELINVMEGTEVTGPVGAEISTLCCDSRQVVPGTLFFALPGTKVDGLAYVSQALTKGAVAVVAEKVPPGWTGERSLVLVDNVRRCMALAASHYYHQPSAGIPVVGITGTNGKTTITYLLESILRQADYSPAVFGTVNYRLGAWQISSSHTTPESIDLMRVMGEFRAQGADALILEVSSHALEQHRADGINFDVAVFTNLTPEHLDYHGEMDSYFASKRRLFADLLGEGRAVLNRDDAFGRLLLEEFPDATSFGVTDAAVSVERIELGRDGIRGDFKTPAGLVPVNSGLIGEFNVSNLLAAVAAATALGLPAEQIAAGIAAAPQVPGRLERVTNDRGILALVDYAHTGDALEQVLRTLSQLERRKLISLVGCGGDRDPAKRPVMAAAATSYSDLTVLTSDNPRTEDPLHILAQMREGALANSVTEFEPGQVDQACGRAFVVIPDRREAIRFAVNQAGSGDLLLVAGKGHEDYQIIGREKVHFDDREELGLALGSQRISGVQGSI
ncbi:MAG: UDP-N-acetylmuramoyl-L-alanyl-D-glutamate--2,6-diaminopimelate ligase [Desulfuromonadales bacterium]|nr:UDP-N-acetylmuramoyl-L-alanyl-D-glutamate--2,6-diaminopimelate ligase [Desulfuromonadales bacterium]